MTNDEEYGNANRYKIENIKDHFIKSYAKLDNNNAQDIKKFNKK